jgi:geranylgeranyl diphosphate synthase, type I
MDFKDYLQKSVSEIEEELAKYLQNWLKEVESIDPKLIPLQKVFVDSNKGGKRIRGCLVKLGYELVTSKSNPEILKIAAAVEIFQTAILAHDDIIDLSPTRRGQPTIYQKLGGDHYGISQAICLGDIGFFLALRLIEESNFPADLKAKTVSEFSKMFIQTASGEMLDVETGNFDEKDILTIYKLKTAYYALVYPLVTGTTLAGGDSKLVDTLTKFGENLGIAFQIQDDILGVFGDEKTLGKSIKSDIEEGKKTLLISYALKNATSNQKLRLPILYGKKGITQSELEEIRQIFIDSGAKDYANSQAKDYIDKAKKYLKQISVNKEKLTILTQMSDFIIQRSF